MFKVGDKVRAFGCDGVVIHILTGLPYPVGVDFGYGEEDSFTLDGKHQGYHKESSLVLIERPKQLVKKYLWAYCEEGNQKWCTSAYFYTDEAEAKKGLGQVIKRIDSVFIEVEE